MSIKDINKLKIDLYDYVKKIARAEFRIAKKTLNCCRVSGNVYSSKAIQRLGG